MLHLVAAITFALCWLLAAGQRAAAEYTAPPDHVYDEHIAREVVYTGGDAKGGPAMADDPALKAALAKDHLTLRDSIDDPKSGMQAMVLQRENGQTFIAFRGTWPSPREGVMDAIADSDRAGDTGNSQYEKHKAKLDKWANDFPNSIVTGHSLGAALGQRFIADHPGNVKEGVLFNAPGIATVHAQTFARAPVKPPVTIYVGKSTVMPGTEAPGYDIVSEFGGRSHLPSRIVEVTDLEPRAGLDSCVTEKIKPKGIGTALTTAAAIKACGQNAGEEIKALGGVMLNSHTATMLSGDGKRTIEEIPYDEYEKRRQKNWESGEPIWNAVREGLVGVDALKGIAQDVKPWYDALPQWIKDRLFPKSVNEGISEAEKTVRENPQIGMTADAIMDLAHGFGATGGPARPTPGMAETAERHCDPAAGIAEQARGAVAGEPSLEKLNAARAHLQTAWAQVMNCPLTLARIAAAQAEIDAAVQRFGKQAVGKAEGVLLSCNVAELRSTANGLPTGTGDPDVDRVRQDLLERAQSIDQTSGRLDSLNPQLAAARDAGNLAGMESIYNQAIAIMRNSTSARCHEDRLARAEANLGKVTELKPRIAAVDAVIASCDADQIDQQESAFARSNNAFAAAIAARLRGARSTCEEKRAKQDRVCVDKHGSGWTVGKRDGENIWCQPTQEAADARCAELNPDRTTHAANITNEGAFECLMTMADATAWCNAHNSGGNWQVKNFNANGQFECFKSAEQVTREATADCINQYQSQFSHVEFLPDGRYRCRYCTSGVPRGGRCYQTARRPGSQRRCPDGYFWNGAACQNAAATAAAVAGAVGAVLQRSRSGGGGGGQRCHIRPGTGPGTGRPAQWHCQ